MKKHLLFATAALAAALPHFAIAEENPENSSNIKLVWKNTDLSPVGTSKVYQGHVYDDKYYIMNGETNKVIIMDKNGKVGEIAAPNCWMNFGKDEAGNFILRKSEAFNDYFYKDGVCQYQIGLLNPRTNELTICKTTPGGYQNGPYGAVNYTFGTAAGNVFGDDENETYSAKMAMAPQYGATYPIYFWGGDVDNSGAHRGEWDWQYVAGADDLPCSLIDPFTKREKAPKMASTIVISTYSFLKRFAIDEDTNKEYEEYLPEAVTLNPYYDLTGESNGTGNSITHLISNPRSEYYWGGFYVTPGHNGMQGFELFEVGNERYIVYTSGEENCDGFSVARVDKDYDNYLRESPVSTPEDAKYLVAEKKFDTDELGFQKWVEPGTSIWCHINSFDVVPSNEEGHVFIYQYVPGAYIAKYDIDLTGQGAGIEDLTVNDQTKIYGAEGKITVIGEEADVFTIDGKFIARGNGSIPCNPGMYIVKAGSKTAKVLVK